MKKKINFTKMQACGNDYIYINCFYQTINHPSKLAIILSDRHYSIGGDGLILIYPSKIAQAKMVMFNKDGSESKMCGNGLRCVAKYVAENILEKIPNEIKIEIDTKIYNIKLIKQNNEVTKAIINMGKPNFDPLEIPVNLKKEQVLNYPLTILDKKFFINCVNVGNPHCVIFLDESINNFEINKYGSLIEYLEIFPQKTNVEFVNLINSQNIKQRTWERGTGETLSCGSGATASAIIGILTKNLKSPVNVELLGGILTIHWENEESDVFLEGEAKKVFDGTIEIDD